MKPLTIHALLRAYRDGSLAPPDHIAALRAQWRGDDPAWITLCGDAFIAAQLKALSGAAPASLPLYGVPFAVKDNIDVAGLPTTAACPAFAYTPSQHATAVQRLIEAGAVLVGKTNLDQFATGLVGTRSPYGEVPNAFDADHVSGGSSSGSASVVARGLVPFALGTDTAGSGRVPAGFNNIVGLKPTPGRVGMNGVVPACRTLDVVSVFALTVEDAARVMSVIDGKDGGASFQRHPLRPARFGQPLRIGVPSATQWPGDEGYAPAWQHALRGAQSLAGPLTRIDLSVLYEVARLLYDGPWVAERYAVMQGLLQARPDAVDAVVRRVVESAREHDATAAFRAQYRLHELAREAAAIWREVDVLMLPTAPTCPTRAAVAAEPIVRNSELGRYTNFVNLLGLAALAVPAAFTERGLPFGVTFVAPGGSDAALAELGARWQAQQRLPLGARLGDASADELTLTSRIAAEPTLAVAVVGAHLEGLPLHGQLVERRCTLRARTRTAPRYRLHALPGTQPPKPGLARVDEGGAAIEVEVYDMPQSELGSFLALIPPPLGLGSIELADGEWVKGFICEPWALQGSPDISAHGGWRAYLSSQ
ncbi:MAG TPA: allophanate hydrolase [Burkholderiaceae bacterium]|nr:allophanate hydrolase [Burkholderiaceae bacterium]